MPRAVAANCGDTRRRRFGQHGFMLVEALVAIAIIGTGILAGVSALSTTSLVTSKVANDTTASWMATSQLDLIQGSPYVATLGEGNYPSINTPAGYSITNTTSAFPGGNGFIQTVTVRVFKGGEELLSVDMVKVDR